MFPGRGEDEWLTIEAGAAPVKALKGQEVKGKSEWMAGAGRGWWLHFEGVGIGGAGLGFFCPLVPCAPENGSKEWRSWNGIPRIEN
jgi:hypothetical protein